MKLSTSPIVIPVQIKNALEDITFTIEKGEIFGFLGPSGAGKSTTQAIITSLLPLQQGEVSVDGIPVPKLGKSFFNRLGVSLNCPTSTKIDRL